MSLHQEQLRRTRNPSKLRPRVQRRLCCQRLSRRRRFCVQRLHPDSANGLHVIFTGGACRVPTSTWMAPSPIAPPSQHLKKKDATVLPRRQNEDIYINSFKTRAFS
ncbi:hypothetical protein PIB30_067975 [Stylosanthes scabra]|uniref:Uncharacterized protein n=1 Tax=Stylosanthes scabra TaxID=79078 RepID=A0ABU6VPI8_9FABA|nr:hypothetical protein [Stylosanthes scabra]